VPADPGATIDVEVVYCPAPGQVDQVRLQLPVPSTVADALRESGVLARHGLEAAAVKVGVWCKARPLEHPLREHDRVEVYRPLQVDPKEARRQRYRKQRQSRDPAA
jgi:putative ubiquitin-RnfH superfamily antitoxin RatB of RatAB toxin-antitoxin module